MGSHLPHLPPWQVWIQGWCVELESRGPAPAVADCFTFWDSVVVSSNLVLRSLSGAWVKTLALPCQGSRDLVMNAYSVSFMGHFFIPADSLMPGCPTHDRVFLSQKTCLYWKMPLGLLSDLCPVYSYQDSHSLGEPWLRKMLYVYVPCWGGYQEEAALGRFMHLLHWGTRRN